MSKEADKLLEPAPAAQIRKIKRRWFEYKLVPAETVPALEIAINKQATQGFSVKSIITMGTKLIAIMEVERLQYEAEPKNEEAPVEQFA